MKVCHLITRRIAGSTQVNTLSSARGLREAVHESVLTTGPDTLIAEYEKHLEINKKGLTMP